MIASNEKGALLATTPGEAPQTTPPPEQSCVLPLQNTTDSKPKNHPQTSFRQDLSILPTAELEALISELSLEIWYEERFAVPNGFSEAACEADALAVEIQAEIDRRRAVGPLTLSAIAQLAPCQLTPHAMHCTSSAQIKELSMAAFAMAKTCVANREPDQAPFWREHGGKLIDELARRERKRQWAVSI